VEAVAVDFVSDEFSVPKTDAQQSKVYSYDKATRTTSERCTNNLECLKPGYHEDTNPTRAGETGYYLLEQVRECSYTLRPRAPRLRARWRGARSE